MADGSKLQIAARLTARSHHLLAMLKLKFVFEIYDGVDAAVRSFALRPHQPFQRPTALRSSGVGLGPVAANAGPMSKNTRTPCS